MLIVGLTGPTGAGKGKAARAFAQRGFAVVDADAVAHEVMAPGTPCTADVARAFGPGVLGADGAPDRKRLGTLVFADPQKLARLDAVTHPHIVAEIGRRLDAFAAQGFPGALVDAPALFESGAQRLCDRVVAVVAPASLRLARIMARDGLGEARARQRVAAQPDEAFYTGPADFVLRNEGDLARFSREAGALADRLLSGSPPAEDCACADE